MNQSAQGAWLFMPRALLIITVFVFFLICLQHLEQQWNTSVCSLFINHLFSWLHRLQSSCQTFLATRGGLIGAHCVRTGEDPQTLIFWHISGAVIDTEERCINNFSFWRSACIKQTHFFDLNSFLVSWVSVRSFRSCLIKHDVHFTNSDPTGVIKNNKFNYFSYNVIEKSLPYACTVCLSLHLKHRDSNGQNSESESTLAIRSDLVSTTFKWWWAKPSTGHANWSGPEIKS